MKPKILIVEDEAIEAMNFEQSLKSFNYDVVGIASAGGDAIEKVANLKPDLVLMDIVLKGDMDGIEAASKIKEDFDIPVVYLTAHPEQSAIDRAKLTTPYGYLIKPVSKTELKNTIELALYKHQMEATLKESERKYRNLFSFMNEGVAVHKIIYDEHEVPVDYELLDVNPAFEAILGLNKKEVVGKNASNVYDVGAAPFLNIYSEVARTSKSRQFESYFEPMDKYFNISVFSPAKGFFATVFEDISQRKKTEDELRHSNEWLSFTQKSSKSGFWDWDMVDEKLIWSPEFYQLFGLSIEDEPSFDTWLDILHPDDRELAMDKINQAIESHEFLINEYRVVLPDGDEIWVRALGTTYYDENDQPMRMSGICIDITPIKLEQDEHTKLELKYKSLFDNMLNGFAYCKMIYENNKPVDFVYISVNPAFDSLTGLKDVIGKRVSEVIPGIQESDPELLEIYGRVAVTGEPETFEIYLESLKDWFQVSVYSPQKNYFVAVFEITTKRKMAEKELNESENSLNAFINAINEAAFMIDTKGNYLLVNDALSKRLGIPKNELIGKNAFNDMPDKLAANRINNMNNAIESKEPQAFSDINEGLNLNNYIYPVLDINGEVKRLAIFSHDVTELRKTEKALRETEKQYENIVETTQEGVWVLDAEANTSYVNQAMADMLGYTMNDMMGKPLFYFMDEEGKIDATEKMERRRKGYKRDT